jgi:biotin synthase
VFPIDTADANTALHGTVLYIHARKRTLCMQALMFMAGANSIFNGDKLLTTPNPEFNEDTKV